MFLFGFAVSCPVQVLITGAQVSPPPPPPMQFNPFVPLLEIACWLCDYHLIACWLCDYHLIAWWCCVTII